MATTVTALGAAIDANNTDSLGSVFKFCYLLGCVGAALMVRRRALFTAAAQPPLIAFGVGVITLYGLNAAEASGIKSLVFKVLLPIANDFPWMALTFFVTLALVVARWWLTRDASGKSSKRSAGPRSPAPTSRAAAQDKRKRPEKASNQACSGDRPRTQQRRAATTESAVAAAATRRSDSESPQKSRAGSPPATRAEAPKHSDARKRPEPQKRPEPHNRPERTASAPAPSRAREAVGARSGPSPQPHTGETPTAARRRATAGQVMRAEHGSHLDGRADEDSQPPTPRSRPARESETYESRMGTASPYPSTRSRNRR